MSLAEPTVEPSRVSHETECVANIVFDMFAAAPYRRNDDNFAFLQKYLWARNQRSLDLQHTWPWNSSTLPTLTSSATARRVARSFLTCAWYGVMIPGSGQDYPKVQGDSNLTNIMVRWGWSISNLRMIYI